MSVATVAQAIVLLSGVSVCLLSIWAMSNPERLRQLVHAVTDTNLGYYTAAAVRILLGLALIFCAPASRFPILFQLVGWLAIVAAIGLLTIGREWHKKLVVWFDRLSNMVYRAWLTVAVGFGLFLIYGAS